MVSLFTCQRYKQSRRWKSVYLYEQYNHLHEYEYSDLKHVEEIVKIKILIRKCALCWFIIYKEEGCLAIYTVSGTQRFI